MCYSAMVRQNANELGFHYKAYVRTDLYDDLFTRRLNGEKLYLNKGLEESFLSGLPESKGIAEKIVKWHDNQISEIEQNIKKQSERLELAESSLLKKQTKKAVNDKRISTEKILKFNRDLDRHKNIKNLSDSDSRIYPHHYVSMLTLDENGKRVILPIRYLMRPHDKDEKFDLDFNGCYNARIDSLLRVKWWSHSLEKHRGIIFIQKFYENVATNNYTKNFKLDDKKTSSQNLVIEFKPGDFEIMFVPVLWDVWSKKDQSALYSGALITDEPSPEICQTGHDRAPIFLKESAIDNWLDYTKTGLDALKILKECEKPIYSHRVYFEP